MAYFGDGAANQGQVYETFNMAALWQLPIVFVVENNGYAMGTGCQARSLAETHFHRRGTGFAHSRHGTSTAWTCWTCAAPPKSRSIMSAPAMARCMMELNTYRYRGHSMSDPAKYRSREEVQAMRDDHDPIEGAKQDLLRPGRDRGR